MVPWAASSIHAVAIVAAVIRFCLNGLLWYLRPTDSYWLAGLRYFRACCLSADLCSICKGCAVVTPVKDCPSARKSGTVDKIVAHLVTIPKKAAPHAAGAKSNKGIQCNETIISCIPAKARRVATTSRQALVSADPSPKELRSLSPVESSRSVCSPSVPPSAAMFTSEPYIPVRAPKRGDAIPARHLCIRVRRFLVAQIVIEER